MAESVQELLNQDYSLQEATEKVGATFGLSPAAVRIRFKRAGGNTERRHGNMLLSDSQDETLTVGMRPRVVTVGTAPSCIGLIVDQDWNDREV